MNQSRLTKTLVIQFMFIDLHTCGRCLGTEEALDAAVALAAPPLQALGVSLSVEKRLVDSPQRALELSFRSSPTSRIGGREIQTQLNESNCGDCGDICGDSTDCRVWSWRGQLHTAAPAGLLVEAILQAAISPPAAPHSEATYTLPDNLRQSFARKNERLAKSQSESMSAAQCCGPGGAAKVACGC